MNEETTASGTSPQATDAPDAPDASLADELRAMGQRLAAAARAAASTPEAHELRADLHEGLRQVKSEIDQVLAKAPVESLREKAQSPRAGQVRAELAGAVRALNRVLDRLAATVEPGENGDREPPEDQSAPSGDAADEGNSP